MDCTTFQMTVCIFQGGARSARFRVSLMHLCCIARGSI